MIFLHFVLIISAIKLKMDCKSRRKSCLQYMNFEGLGVTLKLQKLCYF